MKARKFETNQSENANTAYKTTLKDILDSGAEIEGGNTPSVGSNKKSKEILNYNLHLSNPVQRLLDSSSRAFNLPGAIARFVWMMAANNRLADIEFYWGFKVANFTDDGYTVPGSSYGARMFNASPGLDQIEAVIKRLKEDHSTRRAAVSIYHPVDAIRESKDIPCTFGLFYHVRDKKLVSTVVMRSNNAFILLPYNIFEFSLLAEVIANEVGVEMGDMYYNAMSMHIFEENYEKASQIVHNNDEITEIDFPKMPSSPNPLGEIKKLIRLESHIRHVSAGLNNSNIDKWISDEIEIGEKGIETIKLDDYWKQFYYLLLYFIVSKKTDDKLALKKVTDLIEEPYKKYLDADESQTLEPSMQYDLFGNLSGNPDYFAYSQYNRQLNSFERMCDEYNEAEKVKDSSKIIGLREYVKLRDELVGSPNEIGSMAARKQRPEITKEHFQKQVNKLFS